MVYNGGIEAPEAVGLEPEDAYRFKKLWGVWQAKLIRNQLRNTFYEAKNMLDNMGISVPPELEDFATVVGWPAKAVDHLANRSILEGFTFAGDTFTEFDEVLEDNSFDETYVESTSSELINSCACMTVSRGLDYEPKAIVTAYSAEEFAAIWNTRRKCIDYGMTITKVVEGRPNQINFYTDTHIIVLRDIGDVWTAEYFEHLHRRPLMEALRYRPTLKRPMGKSRISRTVMDLSASAMRTTLRTEVAAEFFTSPQKYVVGYNTDMFKVDEKGNPIDPKRAKWDAFLGSILVLGTNEEGEKPDFGQLAQMTMTPHIEHLRSLAAQFSGETGVPMSSLGIIHDNPSSAEAIYAAKEDLVIEAEHLNRVNGLALKNIGKLVIATMQNKPLSKLTDEEKTIEPRFKNPAIPSIVSQSDAVVKISSAIPGFGQTDVALERLGFSKDEIMRIRSDMRRADAKSLIDSLNNSGVTNAAIENKV